MLKIVNYKNHVIIGALSTVELGTYVRSKKQLFSDI